MSDRDGNTEIYVMNAVGSGLTRLTNNPAQDRYPTWAPDGRQIAFVSNSDGNAKIYVIDIDGNDLRRLTNDPVLNFYLLQFFNRDTFLGGLKSQLILFFVNIHQNRIT